MKKKLLFAGAIAFGISGSSFAKDETGPIILSDAELAALTAGTVTDFEPGQNGQVKAIFGTKGFAIASSKNGRGLVHATYIIGNKGKGNGNDPALDIADHDPGVLGGDPDPTR